MVTSARRSFEIHTQSTRYVIAARLLVGNAHSTDHVSPVASTQSGETSRSRVNFAGRACRANLQCDDSFLKRTDSSTRRRPLLTRRNPNRSCDHTPMPLRWYWTRHRGLCPSPKACAGRSDRGLAGPGNSSCARWRNWQAKKSVYYRLKSRKPDGR